MNSIEVKLSAAEAESLANVIAYLKRDEMRDCENAEQEVEFATDGHISKDLIVLAAILRKADMNSRPDTVPGDGQGESTDQNDTPTKTA